MASSSGQSPQSERASAPATPERVHFAARGESSPRTSRTRATVKYNRKAVQKVLAIEEWVEEQLVNLFRVDKGHSAPVEISLDDLMAEEQEAYDQWIRDKLKDCPAEQESIDAFAADLIHKVKSL